MTALSIVGGFTCNATVVVSLGQTVDNLMGHGERRRFERSRRKGTPGQKREHPFSVLVCHTSGRHQDNSTTRLDCQWQDPSQRRHYTNNERALTSRAISPPDTAGTATKANAASSLTGSPVRGARSKQITIPLPKAWLYGLNLFFFLISKSTFTVAPSSTSTSIVTFPATGCQARTLCLPAGTSVISNDPSPPDTSK